MDQAMAKIVAASQNASKKTTKEEESKSGGASSGLADKLTSQTEQLNLLTLDLAKTQKKLVQAQLKLATPAQSKQSSSNKESKGCEKHAGSTCSDLFDSWQRAECEIQRLKLRIDNRPVPYYKVISEFFEKKLGNFVDQDHTCTCNVCCLDIEGVKKKAVEDALTQLESQRRASDVAQSKDQEGGSSSLQKLSGGGGGGSLIVNQQEHQGLLDQIEELKQDLALRDQCLKQLQARFERLLGSGKSLVTEEALYGSSSMKVLLSQVSTLITEVDQRESSEHQLNDLQIKFQALLTDRKQMDSNYKARIEELKSKIESSESEKRQILDKLHRARSSQQTEHGQRNLEADYTSLQNKYQRSDKLSSQRATDLKSEMQKARTLNTKLVASETHVNELQKKYDESKRNYLRIRDERERLKVDLEQARGGGTSGAISTGEASVAAESKPKVPAAAASSLSEVQAKYEGLKTKFKVAEETAKSADKRATQIEEEVKGKNEQLEDMYTQIDSMQECIDQLEQDRTENQTQTSQLQKQSQEMQRANMDLQLRCQQQEGELASFKTSQTEYNSQQERLAELLSSVQLELDLKKQIAVELEEHAELQKQVIQALQTELGEAQLAQAQAGSKFQLATDSYAKMETHLGDARKELDVNKQRLKNRQANAGDLTLTGMDQEIACMKYQLWKPKMSCGSCTDNGNDVEVFLPCGHMLCQPCLTQLRKSRSRACPFDRQRFTDNEPKKIYWAADH